jgi:hypothetical protein
MYQGDIIAQYKSMFDIADIYEDKREGQDFLDTLFPVSNVLSVEVLSKAFFCYRRS